MLGKFTGKHKSDSRLNFSRAQSGLLVVGCQFSRFTCDALENIVNERVHDRHALLRDTSVGVNLLENFVNVRRIRLSTLLVLGTGGCLLWSLCGLL